MLPENAVDHAINPTERAAAYAVLRVTSLTPTANDRHSYLFNRAIVLIAIGDDESAYDALQAIPVEFADEEDVVVLKSKAG